MKKLFGTDGVRGVANASLTCEAACDLGKAVGLFLFNKGHTKPTVLLARDTRASGPAIAAAMSAGLMAAGADVLDAGVLPTPAAAYLAPYYAAHAAAVVSASHNPPEYNGVKLFDGEGRKFSDADEETIEILMNERPRLLGRGFGRRYDFSDAAIPYGEHIAKCAPCRLDGMKIVLDCAWGAAFAIAPRVFKELGAEVTAINAKGKGALINAGCGAACPDAVSRYSMELAPLGFAFDGDADRCVAAENGKIYDGDKLLYAHAAELKRRGALKGGAIAGTVMSGLGLEKALNQSGVGLRRADVGDKRVLETMEKESLVLGGEASGHIIFRGDAATGDGVLTAVKTACLLKKSGKTLAGLCEPLAEYPIKMYNIDWGGADPLSVPEIAAAYGAAKAALGGAGRIVLRRSGTEPKLRIMAQGEDGTAVEQAAGLVKEAAERWKLKIEN
ncbi:MAG: phosphoglucosamine mutase [Clostridiales bacterium]|jgi:phosphoglucosamine mutase|nr:phosphoglucosamine mutase [Clostridiales bacterium]